MAKTSEEKRAYASGYQAGKRKKESDLAELRRKLSDQEFHDKAFLAALPFALEQTNWTIGDKPISSVEDRVAFAARIADAALRHRRKLA